ncbi:RHS repeat-associated core domain-containing protein [Cerasicoccus maritimus]|uniref:RHS repeat-associated core domain-containing protein n=1 Tax=Cerasicoccus maritimus TaxID=490089 RepID=UPI0028525FFA|nr:RHS repeat-associated core domain-containing protein [Cerasicoccus maritimus]
MPEIGAISDQVILEGDTASLSVIASDADLGQSISYELIDAPDWVTLHSSDPQNVFISYSPTSVEAPGLYSILVRVLDDGTPRRFVEKKFDIRVLKNISFDDSILEAQIRSLLGLNGTAVITDQDMESLVGELDLSPFDIVDLSGLEYAINLSGLNITGGQLSSDPASGNAEVITSLEAAGVVVNVSNQPPFVAIGEDLLVDATTSSISLTPITADDGLPVAAAWTWAYEPLTLSGQFSNASGPATDFTNFEPGAYTLTLTADDGVYAVSDTMQLLVRPEPATPSVLPSGIQEPLGVSLSSPSACDIYYYIDSSLAGVTPLAEEFTLYDGSSLLNINESVDLYLYTSGSYLDDADVVITGPYEYRIGIGAGSGSGLIGWYYDYPNSITTGPELMAGAPIGYSHPMSGLSAENTDSDNYGVVWTGELEAQFSEVYTFTITSNAGSRLCVGDSLIVDTWEDNIVENQSGDISLVAGQRYPIRVEYYYNGTGGASFSLQWGSKSQALEVIPDTQLHSLQPQINGTLSGPALFLNGVVVNSTEAELYATGGMSVNPTDEISLSLPTSATSIRYTIDGSMPNAASPLYVTPLSFDEDVTLTARAFADTFKASGPTIAYLKVNNDGPTLSDLEWEGSDLGEAAPSIAETGNFSISAIDETGVERVEFYISDASESYTDLLGVDYSGENAIYTQRFNPLDYPDGVGYLIKVLAYDRLGLDSAETIATFNVDLSAPEAPLISGNAPVNVNNSQYTLSGTAGARADYVNISVVFNNNTSDSTADDVTTDYNNVPVNDGSWSRLLQFTQDGDYAVSVVAYNRSDEASSAVSILIKRDASIPPAPIGVSIVGGIGGTPKISWRQPAYAGQISHYDVYRRVAGSGADFSLIYPDSITSLSYKDTSVESGVTYEYCVEAINSLGTRSDKSQVVSIQVDSDAPNLLSSAAGGGLVYSYLADEDGGESISSGLPVFGSGNLTVTLTLDEPLATTPIFYFKPTIGTPIRVQLVESSLNTYTGSIVLDDSSPNAEFTPSLTVRDNSGNEQTLTLDGASTVDGRLVWDTRGAYIDSVSYPVLMQQAFLPDVGEDFIDVTFEVNLDKSVSGLDVANFWLLDESSNSVSSNVVTSQNDSSAYDVSFRIQLNDLGEDGVETFVLSASIPNQFGAVATSSLDQGFTVYTEANHPIGLEAESLPNGEVLLSWQPVSQANGYYIWAKLDDGIADFDNPLNAVALSQDTTSYAVSAGTLVDGDYLFVVTGAVDAASTSDTISCPEVAATVDSVPPSAPIFDPLIAVDTGLFASEGGILAKWQPGSVDTASYELIRADGVGLVDGSFTASTTDLEYVDTMPSSAHSHYAVKAYDAVGNASTLSSYQQLDLAESLPVQNIVATIGSNGEFDCTWSHVAQDQNTTYLVELVDPASGDLVYSKVLSTPSIHYESMLDAGLSMTITPVFSASQGTSKTVELPNLAITRSGEEPIYIGLMNGLGIRIQNQGQIDASGGLLSGSFDQLAQDVFSFEYAAGFLAGDDGNLVLPVAGLPVFDPGQESMTVKWSMGPSVGVSVEYHAEITVDLLMGAMPLEVYATNLTRGTTGEIGFKLTNTSSTPIELITANGDPAEIALSVLDLEGGLIDTVEYFQTTGSANYQAGDYRIQLIQPGETFVSDAVEVLVPDTVDEALYVQAELSQVHYGLREGHPIDLPLDLLVRKKVSTQALGYSVELLTVDAETVDPNAVASILATVPKGTTFVVTGQAFLDDSFGASAPAGNVPVAIKIQKGGVEQIIATTTDSDGQFSYTFNSNEYAAGTYQIAVSHPDYELFDAAGSFVIQSAYLGYSELEVKAPVDYTKIIKVPVLIAGGAELYNLSLQSSFTSEGGVDVPGDNLTVTITPASIDNVSANTEFTIEITGLATESDRIASDFQLVSTETTDVGSDTIVWDTMDFTYAFSVNRPVLAAYEDGSLISTLQLGVYHGESASVDFTLKNAGFVSANDLTLSILKYDDPGNSEDTIEAPNWLRFLASAKIDQLPGQDEVRVVVSADAREIREAEIGFHNDYFIRVSGSNIDNFDLDLSLFVGDPASAQEVTVDFHIINPYYFPSGSDYTPDSSWAQWVDGVGDARITVTADDPNTAQADWFIVTSQTKVTDSSEVAENHGRAQFDLTPGRYRVTVSATGHSTYNGLIFVKPGHSHFEQIALNYSPVSVSWSVTPTTIQDRYDVVVETQFETQVPMPVIVMEPAYINIPNTCAGEVYNGELRVTNYGLIRAFDFDLDFFESDAYYRFELLSDVPDTLEAGESVRIPYRITCLQNIPGTSCATGTDPQAWLDGANDLLPEQLVAGPAGFLGAPVSNYAMVALAASGASSSGYSQSARGCAKFYCPWNPSITWEVCGGLGCGVTVGNLSQSGHNPFPPMGDGPVDKGGTGTNGGGSSPRYSNAGSGSGGGSSSPKCKPPVPCESDPCCGAGNGGGGGGANPDGKASENPCFPRDRNSAGASWVDLVNGEYRDQVEDLRIIVPGGYVSFSRTFNGRYWEVIPKSDCSVEHGEYLSGNVSDLRVTAESLMRPYTNVTYLGYTWSSRAYDLDKSYSFSKVFKQHVTSVNSDTHAYRFLNKETRQWREYDIDTGRLHAFGYENTTVAVYEYADEDYPTQPTGVYDNARVYEDGELVSEGNLVLSIHYNEARLVDYIQDELSGRKVDYSYEDDDATTRTYEISNRLVAVTYFEGTPSELHESFSYDTLHLIGKTTITGGSYVMEYDDDGRIISLLDETGVGKYYDYHFEQNDTTGAATVMYSAGSALSEGNVGLGVVDGRSTYLAIGGKGTHYASETTTEGVTTEFFYDAYGSLFEKRINGERVLYRQVDDSGVLSETIGQYETTKSVYNDFGKVVEEQLPGGGVRYYKWNPTINLLEEFTDAVGTIYQFGHDERGNLTWRTDAVGTSLERSWTYDYTNPFTGLIDDYNRTFVRTDPRGVQTAYEYKGDTVLKTREYNPLDPQYQTSYTYDSASRPTSVTDALGRTTYFGFDEKDRLIWMVNAQGYAMLNTYEGGVLREMASGIPGANVAAYFNSVTGWDAGVIGYLQALDQSSARIEVYEYDPMGRRTETYRVDGSETEVLYEKFTYNEGGKVASVTNGLGQTISYGYDEFGYRSVEAVPYQTDANGGVVTADSVMEYNALGRRVAKVDPLSVETLMGYDLRGRLQSVVEAAGLPEERERTFTYDAESRLTSITVTDGVDTYTTHFEYDALGRRTRIYGDLEHERQFFYDGNDNLVKIIDGRGYETVYSYDDYNRLTSIAVDGVTTAVLTYDRVGNITSLRDGNGNTRYFAYDSLNRRTHESVPQATGYILGSNWQNNPANVMRSYQYNAWGDIVRIEDLGGGLATMTFDRLGRMVAETNPDGLALTHTYDAADNLVKTTWPIVSTSGNTQRTTQQYIRSEANAGLVMQMVSRSGAVTAYQYDARFMPLAQTIQQGATLYMAYDNLGRLSKEWNDVDNPGVGIGGSPTYATEYDYNVLDLVAQLTYPDNGVNGLTRVEHRAYDQFGQLTRINVDEAGVIAGQGNYPIELGYDEVGNMTSLKTYYGASPSSTAETKWYYNARNLVTDKLYAGETLAGNHYQYAYDQSGNLTQRIDAKGIQTDYSYNAFNRLTFIDYPDVLPVGVADTPDVAFSYDQMGRPLSVNNGLYQNTWAYNAAGRVENATQKMWSSGNSVYENLASIDYLFDSEGNRVLMEVACATSPSAPWTTVYNYDAAGRLEVLLDSAVDASSPFQYAYDRQTTQPGAISFPNAFAGVADSSSRIMVYDNLGRMNSISHYGTGGSASSPATSHSYTYDVAGLRDTETLSDSSVRSFSYDEYRQLATADNPTHTLYDYDYSYDPIGNRLSAEVDGVATSYAPNALNQYTSIGGASPDYDANGNMTDRDGNGTADYVWDAENRLVEIQYANAGDYTKFEYDGLSRRNRRIEYVGGVIDDVVCYIYDGLLPIQEQDNAGNVIRQLTRGLDLSDTLDAAGGTGGLLALSMPNAAGSGGWESHYYEYDGNGNVVGLIAGETISGSFTEDESVASYSYSPFGELFSEVSIIDQPYRFSSQETHELSGLVLYLWRAYDPSQGRWLSRDPLEEDGGYNLYVIVLNDPIIHIDEYGLFLGNVKQALKIPYVRDVVVGTVVGAVVGGVSAGLAAKWCGSDSKWEAVLAGAVGGAFAGLITTAIPDKVTENSFWASLAVEGTASLIGTAISTTLYDKLTGNQPSANVKTVRVLAVFVGAVGAASLNGSDVADSMLLGLVTGTAAGLAECGTDKLDDLIDRAGKRGSELSN